MLNAELYFQSWRQLFLEIEYGIVKEGLIMLTSSMHPALLSKNHHLALLIDGNCPNKVIHNGVKETLCELKSKYWIVKGKQLVRKMLFSCTVCRRFEGQPYNMPPRPSLPNNRRASAFIHSGRLCWTSLHQVPGSSILSKV